MKTLIITSCTGEKIYKPANQLIQVDFENPETFETRELELKEYVTPAVEMYTGMQHLRLMEGVTQLREKLGHDIVDLYIVSAGYGLINEDKLVAPYEVTFNTMNSSAISSWSEYLGIHTDLDALISEYDIVFFLLGDKYLKAIKLPFESAKESQKLIFLASNTSRKMIPNQSPYYFLEVGQDDAKAFSYGLVGLKGFLFKLLSKEIVDTAGALIGKIYEDPKQVMSILSKYRKMIAPPVEQINMFEGQVPEQGSKKNKSEKKSLDFYMQESEYAANYNRHMKYFIPEWDDRVDPDYDFLNDRATEGRDTYKDDIYAHEIYATPNYDGILVSKIIVEGSKKKKAQIEQMGIHEFIRFDNTKPVMGDCGAFGYIDEYLPPFESQEILDYYQRLGFNIGVSIDHLIVGKYAADPVERMRRYNLTNANAADFLAKYKQGDYTFLPSGIAQGWSPESYRDAVANLIEMGYQHISLGGLVRTTTKDIIEILKCIKPLVPDYLQLHLFGIARPDALEPFCRLGVTAMDSASHLRRAWLGTGSNYYGVNGKKYAAIRIPPVDGHGVRVKKMVEQGRGTIEEFRTMEQAALKALRDYDKGLISVEETLSPLYQYDEAIGEDREQHRELYQELLEDKPWQQCPCEICRSIGIDVVIFRGNNRNRRRGFHNTYVFYKQLKTIYPND